MQQLVSRVPRGASIVRFWTLLPRVLRVIRDSLNPPPTDCGGEFAENTQPTAHLITALHNRRQARGPLGSFLLLLLCWSFGSARMEHAWRDAAIATGLISSVPTLILPFIPDSATKPGSGLQRILLCFAVGGMMGDVFLHLLPHLLMGEFISAGFMFF